MGKTIVVIIIVLLSLACGALGWEVMRQQVENKGLQDEVNLLNTRLSALEAPKPVQPAAKLVTEDMLDDIGMRMSSIEEQNKKLLASQQELSEKIAALGKSGAAGPSAGNAAPIDIPNMSDEQKEALRELVKKEGDARDLQRANMVKNMVKQRFNAEIQKVSEKLDLTPMQKDDINKLVDKQMDKGFKALMEAFEKGDFESVREQIRGLVEETDMEVKKILDLDQIEKLKELDPDGFGRREADRQKSE